MKTASAIRRIEKQDWEKWKEIRLEALVKLPENFLSSFAAESKKSQEMWLQQIENSSIFGYFIDNKIAGCCILLFEDLEKIYFKEFLKFCRKSSTTHEGRPNFT